MRTKRMNIRISFSKTTIAADIPTKVRPQLNAWANNPPSGILAKPQCYQDF